VQVVWRSTHGSDVQYGNIFNEVSGTVIAMDHDDATANNATDTAEGQRQEQGQEQDGGL
jgi:hypothetical protein